MLPRMRSLQGRKKYKPPYLINATAGDLRHPFLIVNIIDDLPHNNRHGLG